MRLLFSLGAAGAVVSIGQSATAKFETAFTELEKCHLSFGSCIMFRGNSRVGLVPSEESQCNTASKIWVKVYDTADELESASVAELASDVLLARVKDGVPSSSVKNAANVGYDAFFFCNGGTYVMLENSAASKADVLDKLDFHFTMPSILKINAGLLRLSSTISAARSSTDAPSQLVRARVKPSARGPAREIANRIAAAHEKRRRLGSAAQVGDLTVMVDKTMSLDDTKSVSSVVVSISGEDSLQYLASLSDVMVVEPYIENKPYSNGEAALIVMENIENEGDYSTGAVDATDVSGELSLWKAGVDGRGQIVGVGDSGLDTEHCFFSDLNVDEAANKRERLKSTNKVHNYPTHRKVVQYVSFADGFEGEEGTGHGTHVSGTIAGSLSNPDQGKGFKLSSGNVPSYDVGDFQGVAPGSKLAFFDVGLPNVAGLKIPEDIEELFQPSYSIGARIHTNSWGGAFSAYLDPAKGIDKFTYEHQDMVILFAAGNDGPESHTTSYLASSKNAIIVGASYNSDRSYAMLADATGNTGYVCPLSQYTTKNCAQSITSFSAQGPTFDNRFKPDILAPGKFLLSASSKGGDGTTSQPTCGVTAFAGTSMATPVTAGSAALVRQFFLDGYYPSGLATPSDGFNPMGALVKAVLIDGAIYLQGIWERSPVAPLEGNEKPSTIQGFGRVNLRNTLKLEGSNTKGVRNVFLKGDFDDMPMLTSSKTSETFEFDVNAGEEFKATIVWYDPPASTLVTKSIVNDLDIKVVGPNGEEFFPNGFTEPDRLNTVEKVRIRAENVVAGRYTVVVSAHKLNVDNQPFAIVVSGSFQDTTFRPTMSPTPPTAMPTQSPTLSPSKSPTTSPTDAPTTSPSAAPTKSLSAPDEGAGSNDSGLSTPIVAGGVAGGILLVFALIFVGIKFLKPAASKKETVMVAKVVDDVPEAL